MVKLKELLRRISETKAETSVGTVAGGSQREAMTPFETKLIERVKNAAERLEGEAPESHKLNVEVGEFLFEFHSFANWVNKASSRFRECGHRSANCICVDSAGRICLVGAQFMRARDEDTFPIKVYKATTGDW
jgi:hypothetical protein